MRTLQSTIARAALTVLFLATAGRSFAYPADTTAARPDSGSVTVWTSFEAPAPVVLGIDTLFSLSVRLGPATPAERAAAIRARLEKLETDPLVRGDSVVVVDIGDHHEIYCRGTTIMGVTDADARAAGRGRAELAGDFRKIISRALDREIESSSLLSVILRITMAGLATILLGLLLRGRKKILRAVQANVASWAAGKGPSIRIQDAEVISADRFLNLVHAAVRVVGAGILVLLAYVYIVVLVSLFPVTKGAVGKIFGLITIPLLSVWEGLVAYLPNVFFIAAIVAVTWLILRFIGWLASEVGKKTIVLQGFYPEWAGPTYKLVRFIVLAFSFVVAFPYLPGSGSAAFQGVGVFLGLLLSLGSASAISNLIAGFVLIYMRAFAIGDRVRVADTVGDVIEKSLLVTRIRTIKNVDVTVPNGLVLGSHIVNYSAMARRGGLILHTSVTIGYNAPWKTVHELLISAAMATDKILPEPRPFVLQTALSDFFVEYEINAYTDEPNLMQQTYSELHSNIQDKFNEAGVEIMSPHYTSVRDGNQTAIPDPYLPKSYTPPAFRIFPAGGEGGGGGK